MKITDYGQLQNTLEWVVNQDITLRELKVFLVILSQSKSFNISTRTLEKKTGIDRRNLHSVLKSLQNKGFIANKGVDQAGRTRFEICAFPEQTINKTETKPQNLPKHLQTTHDFINEHKLTDFRTRKSLKYTLFSNLADLIKPLNPTQKHLFEVSELLADTYCHQNKDTDQHQYEEWRHQVKEAFLGHFGLKSYPWYIKQEREGYVLDWTDVHRNIARWNELIDNTGDPFNILDFNFFTEEAIKEQFGWTLESFLKEKPIKNEMITPPAPQKEEEYWDPYIMSISKVHPNEWSIGDEDEDDMKRYFEDDSVESKGA